LVSGYALVFILVPSSLSGTYVATERILVCVSELLWDTFRRRSAGERWELFSQWLLCRSPPLTSLQSGHSGDLETSVSLLSRLS